MTRDKFSEYPQQHELAQLPSKTAKDGSNIPGAMFIPIETLETILDEFDNWGTQNFSWYLFRDGYSNLCIAASLELYIEYVDGGNTKRRTFTGACNFPIKQIYPIPHFVATAKSECVKNAASDIGVRFGRGLNKGVTPTEEAESIANDGIKFVENVEDLKIVKDAPKIKNIKDKNTK